MQFIFQRQSNSTLRDMSSPLGSNNNPLMLLGRENQTSFFWKRIKKPNRLTFDAKNAEQNFIYRVMRNQRDLSPIFGRTYSKPELNFTNTEKGITSIRQILQKINPFQEGTHHITQSAKQMQMFKKKAVKILWGAKQFTAGLEQSKRKIRILNKFNRKMQKYCSYLPESPEEETNQSQHANEQLIKLCKHNFFPTEDLNKRANSLMHYQEPQISTLKLQKLKDRVKANSLGKSEDTKIKRFTILDV